MISFGAAASQKDVRSTRITIPGPSPFEQQCSSPHALITHALPWILVVELSLNTIGDKFHRRTVVVPKPGGLCDSLTFGFSSARLRFLGPLAHLLQLSLALLFLPLSLFLLLLRLLLILCPAVTRFELPDCSRLYLRARGIGGEIGDAATVYRAAQAGELPLFYSAAGGLIVKGSKLGSKICPTLR